VNAAGHGEWRVRIAAQRLENQFVSRQRLANPATVVRWFGAIQAQDYLGALWALGLRTLRSSESSIQAALDDGSIIRTHVFRGTWQYVAREDLRWMLALIGPRLLASYASRYRVFGLDEKTLERACELFAEALEEHQTLTRAEMAAVLARRRVSSRGQLMHLLGHAELSGIICSGARRGKQPTFALLRDRTPATKPRTREQALAELAERYFQSRGPATERDFAWWTGLPMRDAREAIELAQPKLEGTTLGEQKYWRAQASPATRRAPGTHLLPAFDECLIAYKDRSAFVDTRYLRAINAGGGMLKPTIFSGGKALATWQRVIDKNTVSITMRPFRKLEGDEREAVAAAAERYARFLGLPSRLRVAR
jgi:hypothetical protein